MSSILIKFDKRPWDIDFNWNVKYGDWCDMYFIHIDLQLWFFEIGKERKWEKEFI